MSKMLCIFEDEQSDHFLPLTWTRPVYELRCGIDSLNRKIRRAYTGVEVGYSVREGLTELLRENNPATPVNTLKPGTVLFVNGRLLADKEKLAAVLTYHVVPGRVNAADILQQRELKTVQGQTVSIDSLSVVSADIETSNGIVHIIDSVLIPAM